MYISIALNNLMFQFGSTLNDLFNHCCFKMNRAFPSLIFLRNHPVCCPLHSPLCSYLVVWWVWILSRSSLPCIAPWWFHRTSFLGHDLLPSGCAPSVFVESYEGGGLPPEGFYSSFRQVHVEDSVKRGEERICTVQWLISQDTNMLQALTLDLN